MDDLKAVILPTKSMQKIVTAIATKVIHLLISSSGVDDTNPIESATHNETLFSGLVASSEATLLALKELVKVTSRTVTSEYSDDEHIVEEVDIAAQNLLVAGENLVLCCQVLASTGGSVDQSSGHHDLPSSISKCFQCLVILLLCVDNAEVRRLVNLHNITLDRLNQLFSSNTLEKLVEHFNSFAIAVHNFHTRATRRCDDLLSSTNHNNMIKGLTTLKHSMPMLTTAFSLAIKYPKNEEAVSSKIFASQQVEKTIKDIVAIIKARSDELDFGGKEKIGLFASHIQSIENVLHPQNRYDLVALELETVVQSLVQRLMALSVFVTKNAPQFSKKSNYLVKDCRKLIELVCIVVKMVPCKAAASSDQAVHPLLAHAEDTSEYGSVCRVARGKLKSLTKSTHSIVISLLSHFLTITTEPLVELKRVYLSWQRNTNPNSLLKLKSCVGCFETHFKDIVQVARFIGMCCDNSFVYKELETCIVDFNELSSQLIELCAASFSQSDDEFDDSKKEVTFAQLVNDWPGLLKALLHCCVLSLEIPQLTSGIESDVLSEFDKCHEEIVNLDEVSLSRHVINATGKAKLLATVGDSVVAGSSDPVYRNGVLSHIKQLNDAIAHVIASANLLIEDTARLAAQEAFLAAASSLKSRVGDVCVALVSKSNHPQLTSEERKGLRDFSDPQKISGMIKQMHSLNQKLANLGFEPNTSPIQFSPQSQNASFTEDIDEVLGTSGPPVNIDNIEGKLCKENVVSFQQGTHPLIEKLLEVCGKPKKDCKLVLESLSDVQKMTRCLNDILDDSESLFTSSSLSVADVLTFPVFVNTKENETETFPIPEVVSTWRKNLNESCSLIEGCIEDDDNFELEMFKSLCETWSKSCRILNGCCVKVLKIFSICVRKYISVSESPCESVDENSSTTSSEEDCSSSPEIHFPMDKSHGDLLMLGRINETLSVLLSDVITLYKREIDNSYTKEKSTPFATRLDVLLTRSRKLSTDLTAARENLKQKTQKLDSGISLEKYDVSWLHVHSLVTASKLYALSSIVETVMKMVIGVRSVFFPIDYFLKGDSKNLQLLRKYKEKMGSLAETTVDKANRALKKHNLEAEEMTKVHKIRDRIEASRQSIEKVLEFILAQKFSEILLKHHGFLICHLIFLHQRFSLEVARILLVIKALALLSASDSDQKNQAIVYSSFPTVKDGKAPEIYSPMKVESFSERLAELTKQRKEREKDLFYLLSDIDNFPIEPKKAQISLPRLNDSEC